MISANTFQTAYGHAASPENERATMRRLDTLARVMDSAVSLPIIGSRIGADAILNVVPVAGLVVAKSLSAYLVWEAYRLGVPRSLITRMVGNVAVDFAISAVPVAGWVGDIFFRANMRNMKLLREHLAERHGPVATAGRAPMTIDGEFTREIER
ncbi:MAG: DUF4112 domain-containing protein [Desulfobacterales bacterium]|nr:DUF4112 domain-containing protein [Desulfobacterales bacterium]